jgi:hypothetical protein
VPLVIFDGEIHGADAGDVIEFVSEKECGVPGFQLVESGHQENMANLFPAPANLFNTLTPPPPLVAVANKPVNIAPCPVGSTRKLRMQIPLASGDDNTNVVDECFGLIASTEDHAQSDQRRLADIPVLICCRRVIWRFIVNSHDGRSVVTVDHRR